MGLLETQTEQVWFSQTYLDPKSNSDGRPLCTAIIAMVTDDPATFSDMHRLPTDELWLFHLGDPIELLLLHPDGRDDLVILGVDVLDGQEVQHVVPAGAWMGARLRAGGEYGVWGNTMAPGYALTRLRRSGRGRSHRALAPSRRADQRAGTPEPLRTRGHNLQVT